MSGKWMTTEQQRGRELGPGNRPGEDVAKRRHHAWDKDNKVGHEEIRKGGQSSSRV